MLAAMLPTASELSLGAIIGLFSLASFAVGWIARGEVDDDDPPFAF